MLKTKPLPTPPKDLVQQSTQLCDRIIAAIQTEGPLDFARYMHYALYEPELGYYTSGLYKLGEQGDYITAPELSPLFGYCLANQCAELMPTLANPVILEFGAGTGKMAVAILRHLQACNSLPTAYSILEVSPHLKACQQETIQAEIPDLAALLHWIDRLPDTAFEGIVLANEVVDAMPVHLIKKEGGAFQELCVDVNTQTEGSTCRFSWHLSTPSNPQLIARIGRLPDKLPDGYLSEINCLAAPWVASISDCLSKGAVIIADYGFPQREYYHPDRRLGTLMCHYRHQAHTNPFFYPGLQDITAHVDFSELALAGKESELKPAGYTSQAPFLFNCGLPELAEHYAEYYPDPYQMAQEIKRLTLPGEMGELFKVIGFSKNLPDQAFRGFAHFDRWGKL